MKKKIMIIVLVILLVILAFPLGFFVNYEIKSHRNKADLGKVETLYTTDETYSKIANIPYDKYVKECNFTGKSVTPAISEASTGEENSKIINKAIEDLSQNGGGTVVIPAGEYKVSTIELKSDVTLFVSNGAKLVSLDCAENENSSSPLNEAVVIANDAKNISVTGSGIICGSGESYTKDAEEEKPLYALEEFNMYTRVIEARKRIRFAKDTARNNIIKFNNCTDIDINNIILNESATWTLVINGCDNVDINNVVIDNNMHVANTDGIDITGGNNISINHCFIATGDDAIVLKPIDMGIHGVTVSDCTLSSFANCFKIGTETAKAVDDVQVDHCYFFMPDGMTYGYSGIAIESADGSFIENIKISDIEMDGISSPLLIWLGNRLKYDEKSVGGISDISIKNVDAKNAEMPSAITGCEVDGKTYYVENVTIENFNVSYRDTKENLFVKKSVSEKSMGDYPEITRISHSYFIDHKFSGYWDLPCYGIFVRHAKNVDYNGYACTPRLCNELEFSYTEDLQ